MAAGSMTARRAIQLTPCSAAMRAKAAVSMSTPAAPWTFQRSRFASLVAAGVATVSRFEQTKREPSLRRARRVLVRVVVGGSSLEPSSESAARARIRSPAPSDGSSPPQRPAMSTLSGCASRSRSAKARSPASPVPVAWQPEPIARASRVVGATSREAHELPRPPIVPSAARTPSRGLAMVAPTAVAS